MTIAEIVFLGVLGGAYLLFVVVLAWTSHTTNKFLAEKEQERLQKLQAEPKAEDGPMARHFDQAA